MLCGGQCSENLHLDCPFADVSLSFAFLYVFPEEISFLYIPKNICQPNRPNWPFRWDKDVYRFHPYYFHLVNIYSLPYKIDGVKFI
jgi:hypothetical protein